MKFQKTVAFSNDVHYNNVTKMLKILLAQRIEGMRILRTPIPVCVRSFTVVKHMKYEEEIMIDLVDVTKSYGPGLPAVSHANLHVDKGEFVFVVGSSGSGKSTLIKLLMKELDSTSGKITVSGERLEGMKHRRVAKYRRKLGVVFQDFRLFKDRNVYENVAFAQRVIGRPTRVIRKRVPEILQEVGLADKYRSFPDELSGGEQQRVALARALVNRPDILLADEPTGNLDPKTSEEIMALLEQINQRGTTVLVVTHNREIVNAMKKRVVTMHDGVIVSDEKEGGYHEA